MRGWDFRLNSRYFLRVESLSQVWHPSHGSPAHGPAAPSSAADGPMSGRPYTCRHSSLCASIPISRQIRPAKGRRKSNKGCHHSNHAKTHRPGKRAAQAPRKMGARLALTNTDTLEHFQEKCEAVFHPECVSKQEDRAFFAIQGKAETLWPEEALHLCVGSHWQSTSSAVRRAAVEASSGKTALTSTRLYKSPGR